MDPSSIPLPPGPAPATNTLPMPTVPAAVPFPPEPNNHPPIAPNPAPTHPPYAEMIYTAIEALKEKNGSSKRAIAKYIEQVYKDQLPPTHSALLTHHLNRLKNNGMLQMVKKSYKLPRSAAAPAPSASPSASSRPRGRPRKAQPQPLPQVQPAQAQAQAQPAGNANILQQQNAEPVWAALGLADEPVPQPGSEVKKRPGRPKKNANAAAAAAGGTPQPGLAVATPGRRGRPPGSKTKKRPGRPPKPGSAAAAAAAAASGWPKRRPGRPPKNQQQATPVTFAAAADPAAVPVLAAAPAAVPAGGVPIVASPRPRGRPKRNVDAAAMPAAVGAGGRGRGRGRGRGGGGRGRGRGRGRGGLSVQPRISTGRPVGRPRKGTTSARSSQNVNNEDLRRKLEHFQSKVKESLAVLKPHFNHESPVTALAAIQELEVLGTMDLNAPLRDETVPQQQQLLPQPLPVQQQQPPPPPLQQQQLPPQQHMYQQQFPQFNLPPYQQQPQQYQQQPQQYQHQPPQQQQLFHP